MYTGIKLQLSRQSVFVKLHGLKHNCKVVVMSKQQQQQQQQYYKPFVFTTTRRILTSEKYNRTKLLEDIGELTSTSAGAEGIAKEISESAINELHLALIKTQQLAASSSKSKNHSLGWKQLFLLAIEAGIPFIGFGFIDNSAMLIAGDFIDRSWGIVLGVSTLASAALGNMISDILGIGLGGAVAQFASRLGIPTATLTLAQTLQPSVKVARTLGCVVGVVIGCLFGMFPLLFMDPLHTERLKRKKRLDNIFGEAVSFIANALNAEAASLFLVDKEKKELWTRASNELAKDVRIPIAHSIVGSCVMRGEPINLENAYLSKDFNPTIDSVMKKKTKTVLCMPIFKLNSTHEVIGVIQVINKSALSLFTTEDERTLSIMATHIALALEDALAIEQDEKKEDETRLLIDVLQAVANNQQVLLRYESEKDVKVKKQN